MCMHVCVCVGLWVFVCVCGCIYIYITYLYAFNQTNIYTLSLEKHSYIITILLS